MADIDVVVQSFLNSGRRITITIDEAATVSQLKSAISSEEGVDTSIMKLLFNSTLLEDSDTLDAVNIVDGSFINTSNNISQLATKENKQVAKLDLSATIRSVNGNPRAVYDITQLPTRYSGNTVVDNPNVGGLVLGRPWVESLPFVNPTLTIGPAVTTAAQSPFVGGGNSYVFSSSTTSYITTPGSEDWAVGTDDFTVEWFSYQTTLSQFQRIFTVGDFPSIKIGVSIESGTFYYWANNSFRYSSSGASTINTWIHWAVVRSSGVTKIYKNGTQLGSQITDTNNITDNSTTFVVGNTNTFATNAALVGNLTNFRWVKGLAVYTGAFSVPTSALTATANANPYGGSNTTAIPTGFTKLLLIP